VAAFSFIEIMFVLGTAATVSAVAVPETLATIDDSRTAAAARYISTRLQRTRMEAVSRNGSAALRLSRLPDHYEFAGYVDGNGNGVLSRDIQSGVDQLFQPIDRLGDHFSGVDFGATADLPAVDPTSPAPGDDPIRLGSSDMVTFTPTGTATSGSLYIRGRRGSQYVVRVYGETGKTRVLRFNAGSGQWTPASDM
jgi:type II secretory pathway pseudopilin PulG